MLEFILYLCVGAIAGTLAGLLGIGGGLIVVPALVIILPMLGLPQAIVVHMAVATSLATVIVTSASSTYAHHCRGAVQWQFVKKAAPILIIGIIIGAEIATRIPGAILARLIALVLFFIALRMFFKKPVAIEHLSVSKEPFWRFASLITLFGCLSAMFGVGGGTFLVPYLHSKFGKTMQQSVATGSACAIILGTAGMITYIIEGLDLPHMIAGATGYVYWPAWLGIVIASTICARFGVRLAHKLPSEKLRYIFAGLLIIVAIKMAV